MKTLEFPVLIVQRLEQNSRLQKYPTSALLVVEVVSDGTMFNS